MELDIKRSRDKSIDKGDIIITTDEGVRHILRYRGTYYVANLDGEIVMSFSSIQKIKEYYKIEQTLKSSDLAITLKGE